MRKWVELFGEPHFLAVFKLSTSHKKVFRTKTGVCRDGTLKNQPNKIGTTHNTFTSSIHLVPFQLVCFVFVSCVHSRVVEGS